MKWTPFQIERLIDLMLENRYLFDMYHRDHCNRQKRSKTLTEMAKRLQNVIPGITKDIVKMKVKSLRGSHRREKKYIEECRKAKANFTPKLRYPRLELLNTRELELNIPIEKSNYVVDEASLSSVEIINSTEETSDKSFPPDTPPKRPRRKRPDSPRPESPIEHTVEGYKKKLRQALDRRKDKGEGRDVPFIQYFWKELQKVEDEDILKDLKKKLLSEVYAAQKKEKQMLQRLLIPPVDITSDDDSRFQVHVPLAAPKEYSLFSTPPQISIESIPSCMAASSSSRSTITSKRAISPPAMIARTTITRIPSKSAAAPPNGKAPMKIFQINCGENLKEDLENELSCFFNFKDKSK